MQEPRQWCMNTSQNPPEKYKFTCQALFLTRSSIS
uniref:Uncharacterized protein n=1 Tax=Rhizophora mucronata TaxID=61149 RepID=A0A2P2N9G7_RHIMU